MFFAIGENYNVITIAIIKKPHLFSVVSLQDVKIYMYQHNMIDRRKKEVCITLG